ncbi:zinc finger-containing [Anaeramoeba flamelloides]|uniref:Zinc finger-containing n=1 Tax=Anaeramoeba flamelloides TaxID=1746091 RepID=A0AAV8A7P1_9EUKA|nr:zinc finger-containing [Anaeramoeba flamelloides]
MSYFTFSSDLQKFNQSRIIKEFNGVTSFSERLIILQKLRPTSIVGLKPKYLEKRFLKKESKNKIKGPIKIKRDCITDLVLLTKKPKKSIERGLATFFKKYFSFGNISHYSREWLVFGTNTKNSQNSNLEIIPPALSTTIINKLNFQKVNCGKGSEKKPKEKNLKIKKTKPKIRVSIRNKNEKKTKEKDNTNEQENEKEKEKEEKCNPRSLTKDFRVKIKKRKKKKKSKSIQTDRKRIPKKVRSDHTKNKSYKSTKRRSNKSKHHSRKKDEIKYQNKRKNRHTHSNSNSNSNFHLRLNKTKQNNNSHHNAKKDKKKKYNSKKKLKSKNKKQKRLNFSGLLHNGLHYSKYNNDQEMISGNETVSEESSSLSTNSSNPSYSSYSSYSSYLSYSSYSSNFSESSSSESNSDELKSSKKKTRKRKKKLITKPSSNKIKKKKFKKNIIKKKKKKFRIIIPSKTINRKHLKKDPQQSPKNNEKPFQPQLQSQEVNFQNPEEHWNWPTSANVNPQFSLPNFEPETFIAQEDVFVSLFPEQNDSDLVIGFN